VIVVGTGPAGATAALELAKNCYVCDTSVFPRSPGVPPAEWIQGFKFQTDKIVKIPRNVMPVPGIDPGLA